MYGGTSYGGDYQCLDPQRQISVGIELTVVLLSCGGCGCSSCVVMLLSVQCVRGNDTKNETGTLRTR